MLRALGAFFVRVGAVFVEGGGGGEGSFRPSFSETHPIVFIPHTQGNAGWYSNFTTDAVAFITTYHAGEEMWTNRDAVPSHAAQQLRAAASCVAAAAAVPSSTSTTVSTSSSASSSSSSSSSSSLLSVRAVNGVSGRPQSVDYACAEGGEYW